MLLWAGSRAARVKVTVSGIPNLLNYCVNRMAYTQFTNVNASRIIRHVMVGDPDAKPYVNPLNAELKPICHLLALLGAHPILRVSRLRVKKSGL